MASSGESGIDIDVKKGSTSGSKSYKKHFKQRSSSSDSHLPGNSKVSHVIVAQLGADETSLVQGHLGFLNLGTDSTDARRPGSHLVLAIVVSIIMPLLGIPAVVMARKAKKSMKNDLMNEARKYSNYSLLLSLVGIFLVVAMLIIIYLLAVSEYYPDMSDASVSSTQATSLAAPRSRWQDPHEHRLPYKRYRGSIYDINYDIFNRYI